jgi:rubredoxin
MQIAELGIKTLDFLIPYSAIPACGRQANSEIGMGEVRRMTQWKCSSCGYTFGAETVPDQCPSCKQTCTFSDVTCYIPDCGGPGNIDPRLVGKKGKPINE